MRHITLAGILLIALGAAAWADFQAGLNAFELGDYAGALEEWRPLAEDGDVRAQHELGFMYAKGQGVKRSYSKAASWFRKAAEQGHALSQKFLADMYRRGRGVERDFAAAAELYREAAEQGHALAQKNLGDMYRKGFGVAKNNRTALKWYRESAEQGEPWGQLSLGRMYEKGRGVDRDYGKAVSWFRKAAEAGNAKAKFKLGLMHEKGLGVDQDIVQAAEWYSAAVADGLEGAQKALRRLERDTAHNAKPLEQVYKGITLIAVPARPGLKKDGKLVAPRDALVALRRSVDLVQGKSPLNAAAIKTLRGRGKVHIVYDTGWEPPHAGRSVIAEFDPDYFGGDSGGKGGTDFVVVIGRQAMTLPADEMSVLLVHFLVGQGMLHLQGLTELIRDLDQKCMAFLYQEQFYQDAKINKRTRKLIGFRKALEDHYCADFKKYMRQHSPAQAKLWNVLNPDVPQLLKVFADYAQEVYER